MSILDHYATLQQDNHYLEQEYDSLISDLERAEDDYDRAAVQRRLDQVQRAIAGNMREMTRIDGILADSELWRAAA